MKWRWPIIMAALALGMAAPHGAGTAERRVTTTTATLPNPACIPAPFHCDPKPK